MEICRGYRRGQEGLLLCFGRPNPFLICAICLYISFCQILWEGLSHHWASPVVTLFSVKEGGFQSQHSPNWARSLLVLFSSHKLHCNLPSATQIPLGNDYHKSAKIIKVIWVNYEKIVLVLCHLLLFCATLLCVCVYFVIMLMAFDNCSYFQVVSGNCVCVCVWTHFLKLIFGSAQNMIC